MYGAAAIVQTFDVVCFFTHAYFPWMKPPLLNPLSSFMMRSYSCLLLPYVWLCYYLRRYHIRTTEVGRALGLCFFTFHAGAVVVYSWMAMKRDGFRVEPFGTILSVHGGLASCALLGWTIG
jgi:hypothetical protein